MFQRILVPVDFSDKSAVAVDRAVELAAGGGEVHLLHVIETINHIPFAELEDFYRRLETKAQRALEELTASRSGGAVAQSSRVVFGKRAQEIVQHAADLGADLLLLSSHSVDPQRPGHGWTTLSYQVAILADCPVLLLK